MKYLSLIFLMALAACGTTPPQPVVPNVPAVQEQQKVVIPTGLTDSCPPLTPLDKANYTQGESVDALQVWFNQYTLCADRFDKLVAVITPALNIKEVNPRAPQAASGVSVQNPPVGQ